MSNIDVLNIRYITYKPVTDIQYIHVTDIDVIGVIYILVYI